MSNHKTHNVFNLIILDESGSMNSIKNTIISGFNEVVQTVKGVAKEYPEQKHFISLVTFNSLKTTTHLENENVEKLKEINRSQYNPTAGTPLFDAMGNSISQLRKITQTHSDYNVLVTILTDGEENSSKEFNQRTIKQMVDELKQENWTFTYIGANHDVENFAATISIDNTMKFEANEQDIKQMFSKEKASRMAYSKKIRNNEDTSKGFYE